MAVKKKRIIKVLKLQISGARANPAPPVGPALGQAGVNIIEFCRAFNEKTQNKEGIIIPVVITVYEDRSYSFVLKTPPAAVLLKRELGIEKGSGEPNKKKVGKIRYEKIIEIAKLKLPDLNTDNIDSAVKQILGTARSMGIEVVYE